MELLILCFSCDLGRKWMRHKKLRIYSMTSHNHHILSDKDARKALSLRWTNAEFISSAQASGQDQSISQ